MDLGTDLRNARERAGFSLSDLVARTRIPLKSLQAIEGNEFSKVPPGIFVRSFIRTYAHEVGVDPAVAIAEFRAMTDPVEDPPHAPEEPQRVDEQSRSRSLLANLSDSGPGWGYAVLVAALLIGLASMTRGPASDATTTAAVNSADTTLETPEPVATTGTGLQVALRADGPCWVRAVVDGEPTFAQVLQQGETYTLTAQRDIVLRVGDPAALSYSVNGQQGQSLGVARVPVTVRFGADGRTSRVS